MHGTPTKPRDLIASVHGPIKCLMTKPPRTVLISGIPLCLAYIAYVLTRKLAQTAKTTYRLSVFQNKQKKSLYYRVEHVEYIFYRIASAGRADSKSFTPRCPIQALRYV